MCHNEDFFGLTITGENYVKKNETVGAVIKYRNEFIRIRISVFKLHEEKCIFQK